MRFLDVAALGAALAWLAPLPACAQDTSQDGQQGMGEVRDGFECGITLSGFQDIREGDVFEVYETRQVERTLA